MMRERVDDRFMAHESAHPGGFQADHVVIGAGSAGAVVAARLSADPSLSVLVVEAGPDHERTALQTSVAGPNFWSSMAEPGRLWPGLVARRVQGDEPRVYARGRGVGGSSAINAMLALDGEPDDYDGWRDRFGCDGWGWDEVGPVFASLGLPRVVGGEPTPVDRALVDVYVGDVEPARLTMTADGRRASAYDLELGPARSRPNLAVLGEALVDRVILDRARAVGVRLADGREITADHVWICAGALHSPAILLRSGITRPGVGRNLKDHPSTQATLLLNERGRVPDDRRCPFTVLRRFDSGVDDRRHDLQLVPMGFVGSGPDAHRVGLLMVAVMAVESSGTVELASDDPRVEPVIEFNLLSAPADLARLRAAMSELARVVRHDAFASICDAVIMDDAGTQPEAVDDDWLRSHIGDYFHAAGTCRMGRPDDPLAVVDTGGRVLGLEGLSVVDASVMPDVPRANTHVPTTMLAHKIMATRAVERWR